MMIWLQYVVTYTVVSCEAAAIHYYVYVFIKHQFCRFSKVLIFTLLKFLHIIVYYTDNSYFYCAFVEHLISKVRCAYVSNTFTPM